MDLEKESQAIGIVPDQTKKSSAYYKRFKEVHDEETASELHITIVTNPFYSSEIIDYLLIFILPYFPLLSACQIKDFGLLRDSNASVENYQGLQKNNIFKGTEEMPAVVYISEQEKLMRGRLLERECTFLTDKQKKKRKFKQEDRIDDAELENEFWLKKKRRTNSFFPSSKFNSTKKKKAIPSENQGVSGDKIDTVAELHGNTEDVVDLTIKEEGKLDESDKSASIVKDEKGTKSDKEPGKIQTVIKKKESPKLKEGTLTNKLIKKIRTGKKSRYECENNVDMEGIYNNLLSDTPNYPAGFPKMEKTKCVEDITLNTESMKSLLPDRWLDDNIVNAFLKVARRRSPISEDILVFDFWFTQKLMLGKILDECYRSWIHTTNMWSYKIWIMPFLLGVHWVLLVVVPSLQLLIHFDSYHTDPPKDFVLKVQSLMQTFPNPQLRATKIRSMWTGWTFYCPKDTPLQGSTGHCGVHVCMWAYIICTGMYINFKDDQLDQVRKNMAHILYSCRESTTIRKKRKRTINTWITALVEPSTILEFTNVGSIKGFSTTLDSCASLHLIATR